VLLSINFCELIIVAIGITTVMVVQTNEININGLELLFWKKRQRICDHSLLWKTMKKPTIRKWFAKQIRDSGVGYMCGRYYHSHNAHPKYVPLIKWVKWAYFIKILLFSQKEETKMQVKDKENIFLLWAWQGSSLLLRICINDGKSEYT